MAFVIARHDGRYEIRESLATPNGPRARTLATFRVLSESVLAHAESRATTPFDRVVVVERASRLGAPHQERTATQAAWELLARLSSPGRLPPALAAALTSRIGAHPAGTLPDSLPPLLDWIGVGPQERGEALRDLLRLTDRIPPRRERARRAFPRIASAAR